MPGAERRTAVPVLHRMPWAGRPLCGDEGRLDVRCVRWCGGTFQTGPTGKVRTVRKRGTERTALAFQRSAQVGIGTTYNGMRSGEDTSELQSPDHLARPLLCVRKTEYNTTARFSFHHPAH